MLDERVAREVIEVIEKALEGRIDADDAAAYLGAMGPEAADELEQAAHQALHFLIDADIREKDPGFDEANRADLMAMKADIEARLLAQDG